MEDYEEKKKKSLKVLRLNQFCIAGMYIRTVNNRKSLIDALFTLYVFGSFSFCLVYYTLSCEFLIEHNLTEFFTVVEYIMMAVSLQSAVVIRMFQPKPVDELIDMLVNGLCDYAEGLSETQVKVYDKTIRLARRKGDGFNFFLVFGTILAIIDFPIKIFIKHGELNPIVNRNGTDINYNLMVPIYMPFDTSGMLGYFTASVLLIGVKYAVGASVTGVVVGFAASAGVLEGHYKMLNISLLEIKERALAKYKKHEGLEELLIDEKSVDQNLLERSLLECLKENIRHHQNLIEYYNLTMDIFGSLILIIFLGNAVIIALCCYLIITVPDPVTIVKFLITLLCEVIISFYVCTGGEGVTEQSEEFFETLYHTPWIEGSVRFKRCILIMMSMATQPVYYKSKYLTQNATIATFSDLVNTSYGYFNLLREFV